jgi:hypothetical protein
MCWHVEFSVEMIDGRTENVEKLERVITDYKIKPDKKSLEEVQFVKGSVVDGYCTALHCDCDFVHGPRKDEGVGSRLLHYPKLFQMIMGQPGVRNLKVRWYWQDDEPKEREEKITIAEFLTRNDASELSSEIEYRILRESYY